MTYRDNWTATTAPGESNGASEGYGPGSKWFDLETGTLYVCRSASVGKADWAAPAPA